MDSTGAATNAVATHYRRVETCFSCKLISILCLTGIGGYLLYVARKRIYKENSQLLVRALGIGSIFLGISEIFNKNPLRK